VSLLLGGRAVPVSGEPLRINEATPMDFAFAPGATGELFIAGLPVPFVGDRAAAEWVADARREQWVGELDLTFTATGAAAVRPRVVVLPGRTTVEGFAFLVEQFRSWAGAGALADPAGRARIWADLAPRVPKRDEERALVAIALLRRALPAFAALHRAPVTASATRREWAALDRTGGRRLLLRRLHPFDPPRPPEAPRFGQVTTLARERSPDTPENRFVTGVVRRLLGLREATAAESLVDTDLAAELASSARALHFLAGEAPWSSLLSAPAPRVSFLLRDHPHYRAFRSLADALDDSLRFSPLPGDPVALGLRTQTLNALFEVWVSQAVRAAVRRRLGLLARPGPPLPRGGAEEALTPRGRVRVAFDRVYPRRGEGIVAIGRKRSPDAVVEWWPTGGQPVVMAVDATWSRNVTYHDDKLGYARSLAHGTPDSMTGAPRLCARRCVVVFPGPRPRVNEIGFALSLATVSAPPSEGGWSLLGSFLDRALEGVVPAGLSAGGFAETGDLAARPSL
jgi:hypothetical protein